MIEEVSEGYKITFGKRSCVKPKSCKGCPLFENLKIEPDFSDYKDVLLVGESPGGEERLKMKPFTGPSGQLLRDTLEDTKSNSFGVGFTNLVLCEGMKKLKLGGEELKEKKEIPGEIENLIQDQIYSSIEYCSDRLWDEIEKLKPKLIVAAGDLVKSVLLPDLRGSISSSAGLIFEGDYFSVLPILHPAYILRASKKFQYFWDQVNEIRLFFTESPGPFKVKLGTEDSITHLFNYDKIVLDVETTSFSPFDSEEGYLPPETNSWLKTIGGKSYFEGEIISLALCGDGITSYIFTPVTFKLYKTRLKELLELKPVLCHNGQFDIPFLNKLGIFPHLRDDTMLMSYAMDESPSHPLKRLSRRFLGLEDWSAALSKYLPTHKTSYTAIPRKVLYHYNGMDTAATFNLGEVLKSRMEKDDISIYNRVLVPSANMFISAFNRGIRVDLLKLITLKKQWEKERYELLTKLKAYGVKNPRSPFQVSDTMKKLKIVDYDAVTLKKNLALLISECKTLGNERGVDFLETIIAYREVQLAINTFLREVATGTSSLDGKFHPDFKLFGTVTGRLTEHTLLNFPKSTRFSEGLRSIFIPEPGYVWGHWDQKNFEMRVYTVINNDEKLKGIFAPTSELPYGRDPHAEVGHMVYGEAYERLNNESLGYTRTAIKAIVFGKMYNRGNDSVAGQIGWSVEDASELGKKVEAFFPGLYGYKKDIIRRLFKFQELVNPLGRRRRFPIITDDNYHEVKAEAFNFPIQSTASDLNLLGMYAIYSLNNPNLFPMFPIHDAIEFQIKEELVDELSKQVTETLKRIPETVLNVSDFNFATDHQIGDTWAAATM